MYSNLYVSVVSLRCTLVYVVCGYGDEREGGGGSSALCFISEPKKYQKTYCELFVQITNHFSF
jgi:hypothetical protein